MNRCIMLIFGLSLLTVLACGCNTEQNVVKGSADLKTYSDPDHGVLCYHVAARDGLFCFTKAQLEGKR